MENNLKLLNVDEARAILGVGRNVMYGLINSENGIPHIKLGRQIRIHPDDLTAWLRQQTIAS